MISLDSDDNASEEENDEEEDAVPLYTYSFMFRRIIMRKNRM